MFEQDYVMRMIHEMVRAGLKMFFNIDTERPTADIIEDKEVQDKLTELLDMANSGMINEAENKLFDLAADKDMAYLETGLLFYSYLNDKEDDFLSEHDFSREEIKDGLKELTARYDVDGLSDIFFE